MLLNQLKHVGLNTESKGQGHEARYALDGLKRPLKESVHRVRGQGSGQNSHEPLKPWDCVKSCSSGSRQSESEPNVSDMKPQRRKTTQK